jgi:hypothetical protein
MTYEKPEVYEVGMAEDVIRCGDGIGTEMNEYFQPVSMLEDFEE